VPEHAGEVRLAAVAQMVLPLDPRIGRVGVMRVAERQVQVGLLRQEQAP